MRMLRNPPCLTSNTRHPLPITSQLPKSCFFMTLLSVEYKVRWLHGDLPLLSANCRFCNSHWHGGLAPAQPSRPMLSLAYRPCLTDCQPLGSDSIFSWHAVRKRSKTVGLPGSDGYKIAGRPWKGERGTKKLQPAWQNDKLEGSLNSQKGYFFLLVLLLGVIDVIDQLEDKRKIYCGRRFSFLTKTEASVKAAKFYSSCRSTYWLSGNNNWTRVHSFVRSVAHLSCR